MTSSGPRIAVLVDADQHLTSLRGIRVAAERAAAERGGEVAVAEAYALWKTPAREPWLAFAARLGFKAIPPEGEEKNAADRAIQARVEELLAEGGVDEFWIASSDLGFAVTAAKIRGAGKEIRIILSATRFPRDLQPSLKLVDPWPDLPDDWRRDILTALRAPMAHCAPRDGGVLLSELETKLKEHSPGFSARHYGFSTLMELLETLPDTYRVEKQAGGGAVLVRAV